MHLTGGQFKGHKVEVPASARPTLSKVRESVFNMLYSCFPNGATFLDMFAGSAIMGLEAVSRGYSVTEIEINPKTANIIRLNYNKIKVKPDIVVCDSLKFNSEKKWDVIYIDPPWQYDYKEILRKAKELLNTEGIIIVEYDTQRNIDIDKICKSNDLKILKQKKYGRTLIAFVI